MPADTPYEQFIFDTGQCPVRDGLHDFFNGLAWLNFPEAKRQLNRLQAQEIARAARPPEGAQAQPPGTPGRGRRGPVRDAITVFDENGALLSASPQLWEALRAREWRRLFVDLRPLWARARLVIFGHALLEQLASAPRKGLTAHVWAADAPLQDVDGWLADQLQAERLAAKPFTPLPVLGVPGWCPENANFSFYDDSQVFRPARAPQANTTKAPPDPAGP